MASEIAKPRVYGNFKRRGAKDPHKNSQRYKERAGMDPKHCALIRSCPCAGCGTMPAGTIHHLKSGTGERGAGLRSTDRWGVALCPHCHEDVERAGTKNEQRWFHDRGIDAHVLARDLWGSTGDLKTMMRIVLAHRAHAVTASD